MYSNVVPPTIMRALAHRPDTAKAWPELDGWSSRPISRATIAKNHHGARRQFEGRVDAILLALGREATTARIPSLTCSVMR